jgi:hypothetical protein
LLKSKFQISSFKPCCHFSFGHYRLQGQVDEVIDVMKDNVGKVLERGDRLEDLQDKSGLFQASLHVGQHESL